MVEGEQADYLAIVDNHYKEKTPEGRLNTDKCIATVAKTLDSGYSSTVPSSNGGKALECKKKEFASMKDPEQMAPVGNKTICESLLKTTGTQNGQEVTHPNLPAKFLEVSACKPEHSDSITQCATSDPLNAVQ